MTTFGKGLQIRVGVENLKKNETFEFNKVKMSYNPVIAWLQPSY